VHNVLGTILKIVIAMCIIWQYIMLSNFYCFQLNDCYMFLVPMHLDSVLGRFRRKLEDSPGMAQRVGTGISLLFHDRDTRRV